MNKKEHSEGRPRTTCPLSMRETTAGGQQNNERTTQRLSETQQGRPAMSGKQTAATEAREGHTKNEVGEEPTNCEGGAQTLSGSEESS